MTEHTGRASSTRPSYDSGAATEPQLDDLLAAVEARIDERRSTAWRRLLERVRGWPTRLRLGLSLVAALGLPAMFLAKPRPDWRVAPSLQLAVVVGFCVVLCGPLLSRALRGWHQPTVARQTALTWVLGALLGLVALLALPASHELLPHTRIPEGASFLQHVLPCLLPGIGFAAPVYLLGRLLGRGCPHSHLFAAAGAGLSANLALLLHCPITEPAHLVPAHAGVMAATLLLAWLGGTLRRRGLLRRGRPGAGYPSTDG